MPGAAGGSGIVIIRGVLNTPPTITGEEEDLGDLTDTGLTYTYSVSDEQQETVEVTEAIDGEIIRTYTATGGEENTLSITGDAWKQVLNGTHVVTITATDDAGESTVRTLTFYKDQTVMEFITKDLAPMDSRPVLLTAKLTGTIPEGAVEEYHACNNGLDASPAWEDITGAVKAGYNHTFQNTAKTAEHWAVRVRVKVDRGNLEGDCYEAALFYAFTTEDGDMLANMAALQVDMEYRMTLFELGVI